MGDQYQTIEPQLVLCSQPSRRCMIQQAVLPNVITKRCENCSLPVSATFYYSRLEMFFSRNRTLVICSFKCNNNSRPCSQSLCWSSSHILAVPRLSRLGGRWETGTRLERINIGFKFSSLSPSITDTYFTLEEYE